MKKNSRAFVNQLLICLLVTMMVSGSIGLGTVWLRHQNSLTAKANSDLAARIAEVDRRNDELKTLIQGEKRPERLRHLNAEMRLGLVPKSQMPIENVTENITERMAARANRGLFLDQPAALVVQLKLASR